MPENIHLLTLEPWKPDQILVRFEHILAVDEDEQLAKPVTFDFMDVFRPIKIVSIRETTLAANQWVEHERLQFNEKINDSNEVTQSNIVQSTSNDGNASNDSLSIKPVISARQYFDDNKYGGQKRSRKSETDDDNTSITMNPMQIRTFIVDIEPKLVK